MNSIKMTDGQTIAHSDDTVQSRISLNIFYCHISTKGLGYKFLQH